MTKRKGLLDVKVDVRGLLEELPVSNSAASKARTEQPAILSDSILISNALDVITRQMKVSGNRSRTISDYVMCQSVYKHFCEVSTVLKSQSSSFLK
ncbi:hypothetical protein SB775_08205 [Peribacillus sp. SIMBA_075]|uniref:hypothetical protein n=1 Tax=Peribacillus sp. SIMBA_075 TaxID=3085813 RepID=UPI00397C8E90